MRYILVTEEKDVICRRILEQLPDWFGLLSARERYISEVVGLEMVCAMNGNQAVGFVALKHHNDRNTEIYVMGVLPRWHRCGIGSRLIRYAEQIALERGVRFLTVKTLSPRKIDANFEKTRRFYTAVGFEEFEELPELWGDENPCLQMIKQIGSQPISN